MIHVPMIAAIARWRTVVDATDVDVTTIIVGIMIVGTVEGIVNMIGTANATVVAMAVMRGEGAEEGGDGKIGLLGIDGKTLEV